MAKRQRMNDGTITCSQGMEQRKVIPFLPKEIIFNILIWLPAEFLHNHGKYVCRDWDSIIRDPRFIKKHLLHANPRLLVRDKYLNSTHFIEIKEGTIEVSNLNFELPPGYKLASCEGVLLFYDPCFGQRLIVTNIATMQTVNLCFPSAAKECFHHSCSIGYISLTGKFKVICPCIDFAGMCCWFIQTVGVDASWRKLDSFIKLASWKLYNKYNQKSIGGVIYWFPNWCIFLEHSILAIDLHDECIHYVYPPIENIHGSHYEVMEMENSLCCFLWTNASTEIELLILKDMHQNEWVRAFKVCILKDIHVPICWLDDDKVLVAWVLNNNPISERMGVAYNLKTRAMTWIKDAYFNYGIDRPLRHISSLLSW